MTISRFLPDSFDRSRPIAVIAGKAIYPRLTLDAMRQYELPVRLIAFEGETGADVIASFPETEVALIKVGQLGKLLNALRSFEAGYAIMVGQVTPGRLFRGLHPDGRALLLLGLLKERNAETIFGAVSDEIEKNGVTMLDARAFLDHELAQPGLMTGGRLRADHGALEHGIRTVREVARLDIGQSVVVRKGTIIAVEAFEGTDRMLERAGSFKADALIFLKAVKPGHDFRFDVPVFGIRTLEAMRSAGIGLACLEAGTSLILEKDRVLTRARDWGIQIYGY